MRGNLRIKQDQVLIFKWISNSWCIFLNCKIGRFLAAELIGIAVDSAWATGRGLAATTEEYALHMPLTTSSLGAGPLLWVSHPAAGGKGKHRAEGEEGDKHITSQSQLSNVPDTLKNSLNAENHNTGIENTAPRIVLKPLTWARIPQRDC